MARSIRRTIAAVLAVVLAAALALPGCGGDSADVDVESAPVSTPTSEPTAEPTETPDPIPTAEPTPAATPDTPSVEPAPEGAALVNGELLYTLVEGESASIFAVDPETGVSRRMTEFMQEYVADWSPDSTRFVFQKGYSDPDIVVANADGSHPVIVGSGASPDWSPDGERIAYEGEGIWVINIDGSDAHPVTDGGHNPAWSPDSASIVYERWVYTPSAASPSTGQLSVWSDGAAPSDAVLTEPNPRLGNPSWSPDGSSIAFFAAEEWFDQEPDFEQAVHDRVFLVAPGGGPPTPISPDADQASYPTWSPDGDWIAYIEGDRTIVMIRPDGSDRRELSIETGEGMIEHLSWGAVAASATPATTPSVDTGTPRGSIDDLALSTEGVGLVDFGADADEALRALVAVLGDADFDTGWVDAGIRDDDPFYGGCPGELARRVGWTDAGIAVFLTDWDQSSPDLHANLVTPYFAGAAVTQESSVPTTEGASTGGTLGAWRSVYGDRLFTADEPSEGENLFWIAIGGEQSPNANAGGIRAWVVWPEFPDPPDVSDPLAEMLGPPTDDWIVVYVVSGALCGQ